MNKYDKELMATVSSPLMKPIEFPDGGTVTGRIKHKGPAPHLTELTPADKSKVRTLAGLSSMIQQMQGRMESRVTRTDFEELANRCQHIEQHIRSYLSQGSPMREARDRQEQIVDTIMETVVAQLGLFCAERNMLFDSFRFNAKARKRRE